jgi:serine/alanine adding enzyme
MSFRIISEYDIINKEKWSDFVSNHPLGNAFQIPEMYQVYKSEKYYEPIIVVCIDEKEGICGLIMSVVQREYGGILGKLSSRSIIWGAPLIKDNNKEILNLLLEEYDRIVKSKAVYTQIRNLWDTDNFKSEFEKRGYIFEDHLNILIDLTKNEDTLWSDIYSRRRSQINKSERQGVTIKIFNDYDEIAKSYNILKDVYIRAKLPFPGKEYFKTANTVLGEKGYLKFFGAFAENKIIGVMYLLCYNDRTYEWYIGSYFEFMKIHPNDLIIWEIFKWSKNNHYKIFDFGGAGKPDVEYGVREYKKKFGGKIVNLGRYQKVHNKMLMNISVFGFKIWQIMKFGLRKN